MMEELTYENYQIALDNLMFIISKLSNWSGNDLSVLDENYGLFDCQEILQKLIDKEKGEKE